MKKVLLIRPEYRPMAVNLEDFTGKLPFLAKKAWMLPLGLATIAALTPDDIEVDIWDEAVHGKLYADTDFKKEYDLVGVSGYESHILRSRELSQIFRKRGILVAIGGPGVSAAPERYRDYFDILFIGEAEYTWPHFLEEWKTGSHRSEYRQVIKLDMANSPAPRWQNLYTDIKHYIVGGVQTTRGCPFDCEFCDVIYLFGRRQRHKSINQVLEEVITLERLGLPRIFFCDDNFYGDPKYYKELLRALIALNLSFTHPLIFSTQIDLRVARDDEMLALLADANFSSMFIGIESPNIDSLIESNARKNLETDILRDVKNIQSYGIEIAGSLIVGFDHDDTTIFQRQFEFIQEACIPTPVVNPLRAVTGTKLWIRLLKDGRVIGPTVSDVSNQIPNDSVPLTNIIPKLMSRKELLSGYGDLMERLRNWHNFEARVKGMISGVSRQPHIKPTIARSFNWKQTLGVLRFILFSMDNQARMVTLRLLLYTRRNAPFMIPRVVKMILQNHLWKAHLPTLQQAIYDQIHLESKKGMLLSPLPLVLFVPEAFKKPYKDVFPELYDRVYSGLANKSRIHEVLIEVVYDFLTRWGLTFQQFEEYHQSFLHENCDRSVAKENDNFQRTVPLTLVERTNESSAEEKNENIRHARLADEILRSVEQEIRSFRPPLKTQL